ncbi:LysE family transporter [Candidatus Bathyarchaeota archaeon A05DMB-2]|nr:LysE family transporter [Candidatus Bathyarchaeota archaeon A05DMB-2]
MFLASVVLISLSGVLLPGPLFAVTLEKAAKSKTAGLLIALGHGVVEFPLMFLIYYWLSSFDIPDAVPITVGLIGGLVMMLMGIQTFRKRKNAEEKYFHTTRDSLVAGIWTTAANAGFVLWWLTIGTALIINAQQFGLVGFSVFAVVHWLCDFFWYTVVAFAVFKSRRFWNEKVHSGIFIFCFIIFVGFGAWFFSSALWSALSAIL